MFTVRLPYTTVTCSVVACGSSMHTVTRSNTSNGSP